MLHTARSFNGMIVTPHRLASASGAAMLRNGGNAVEAAITAAATLCVVYPHMTGLGGDGFWLIRQAGEVRPVAVSSAGASAALASRDWYADRGCDAIPTRGPLACVTCAGAVAGWQAALDVAASWPLGARNIASLFSDAISYAREGFAVSSLQSAMTRASLHDLAAVPGFAAQFLENGKSPKAGSRMRLPVLARTLERLAAEGLDSFYHGPLAADIARDLKAAGAPLRLADLQAHQAETGDPLRLDLAEAVLFNTPPPTQGVASLMILGILERLIRLHKPDLTREHELVHAVVEATKQAFLLRDAHLADPAYMERTPESLLHPSLLDALAARIKPDKALPWPQEKGNSGGDTVWIGAVDRYGNAVSCIQSIYHEFGSGVVLPATGIVWHNRGLGFQFKPGHPNSLAPRKRPFHTLNPAMAVFSDGRVMPYGTMGGEGQPQTQAAVFTRAVTLGEPLQRALSAPRWLLGRSWGDQSARLRLEASFTADCFKRLKGMGHHSEKTPAFSSLMGHAGAIVRHPDGLLEGASDPRSDGSVGCW